ncbi:high-affinity iron transporter [Jatrophihabitans endophyticus]|uniref:High-affinity iron transporter n=1 Tax=Jatrophihabitans endophyticus TaxID=1206085 RepID=A0A1M5MD07_9ACTN|nr:iron uptake transporter permease EfeU [Jatrophihabitans endophyticus]SHG75274.1 high-affinity iron transporter [Jatrophihabitans endophyticus]
MLPSFVIGLREGLEAALIVGIIAAFLRKQGRRDLLRWVLVGVGVAVGLCLAAGITLRAYSQNLPQRQQEGLETVIAVLAIAMVTYMVVWMRRNSRNLKGQLEGLASDAMSGAGNAGRAMVLMAFLAVIREGLETVVFLLAAFNETATGSRAGVGAVLGIAIAVALGYGIYRGGVRLNLSKFFRITGFVLVLVAAGLVVNAFRTAHEAGWVDFGQGRTVDLSWLVQPGSVQSSLLTGMLGLQPRPVVVEVVAWLVYLVPVGVYVVWPPGRPVPVRSAVRAGLAVAVVGALAATVLVFVAPDRPATRPLTTAGDGGGAVTAQVRSRTAQGAVVRTQRQAPVTGRVGAAVDLRMRSDGTQEHRGVPADRFTTAAMPGTAAAGEPRTLSLDRIAALNGARIPVGVRYRDGRMPVTYRDTVTATSWLDPRTSRVLDVAWSERVTVVAGTPTNNATLARPLHSATRTLPATTVARAAAAARADHEDLDRRSVLRAAAGWSGAIALAGLVVALGFLVAARRRRRTADVTAAAGDRDLVAS